MQLNRKKIFKVGKIQIYILLIWFFIHSVIILIDGLSDNYAKSDVAVVLGSRVNEDGSPSKRLKARLAVTFELYMNNIVEAIFVSGGIGKEGYDEALIMKQNLLKFGIPEDVIIVDNQGNNTYLTASNFIQINRKYQFESVVLVSQFFHLSRTKLILKKSGFKNVTTAHAQYFEWRDFYSLVREFPAFYL